MSSPPTLTLGTNQSSLDGAKANGGSTVSGIDARLAPAGSEFIAVPGSPGSYMAGKHVTIDAQGAKNASGALARARFITDAPVFDLCFLDDTITSFNLIVDGEMAFAKQQNCFQGYRNARYTTVRFGVNAATYRYYGGSPESISGGITGGTGYAIGDLVTFNGGTGGATGTGSVARVTGVNTGVPTALTFVDGGSYDTKPTLPLTAASATSASGGPSSGTGVQVLTGDFWERVYNYRKMRTIEVLYSANAAFYGVTIGSGSPPLDMVHMAYRNTQLPKIVFVGDSIGAGLYGRYQISAQVAKMLGLWDTYITSAVGGSGWTVNGQGLKWSSPQRIADFIAHNADIYVFEGSQNDVSASPTLEAAVRDTINAIHAAVPRALILGTSNVLGTSDLAASIGNGFAAATQQSQIRYLNSFSPVPWLENPGVWTVVNDANHIGSGAQDVRARIEAQQIVAALRSMVQ